MNRHHLEGAGIAFAGALAAWAAACSWIPLFAAPGTFLLPGAVLAFVVAAIGWSARLRGVGAVPVLLVQLVVSWLLLALWFAPAAGHRGPADVGALGRALVHGTHQINAYASPAPARFVDAAIVLAACVALLAIGVDVSAAALRRAPLAGLLLLLAVTVPISVLAQRMAVWTFVLTGAAFLTLLALAHHRDVRAWGRPASSTPAATGGAPLPGAAIGAGCLAVAIVASIVVPVTHGIFNHTGGTGGSSGTRNVTLSNPLIDLRRDLLQMSHTPLVSARTDDPDPDYVRLSVLDQFTGTQWRAAQRTLPESHQLPGDLPPAAGVDTEPPGTKTHWTMTLSPAFKTSWLPLPSPATSVDIKGEWRYDARTLDVVDVAQSPPDGSVTYTVRAIRPDYDPNVLNRAGRPLGETTDHMTDLPDDLPEVIASTASTVTRGAHTEYEKLVRLQRWFRSTGGFRYSTKPAPGSGMSLLAAFITRDKVGYCEQFAAAMAVMGRTLGIPSRVVVGFLRPTGKAPKGEVEFTSDDLHAWPQFYFAGTGWVGFDPTPGARTGSAPAYTTGHARAKRAQPTKAATPRATRPARPRTAEREAKKAAVHRSTSNHGLWWLLVLPGSLLLGCLPRALRARQRRSRLTVGPDALSATLATGAWTELRASVGDLRLGWEDGRSPRQALSVLGSRIVADADQAADLTWLREYIERAWYAPPAPVAEADAVRVRGIVLALRRALREATPERNVRRARWLPRSLFESAAPTPDETRDRVRA